VELVATTVYLVIYSIALVVLISLGLAVISGMMKVINLAHGEFMMLGAYVCVLSGNAGAPLWASAVASAVLVGAFGVLVERLVIRFLSGRIIDVACHLGPIAVSRGRRHHCLWPAGSKLVDELRQCLARWHEPVRI
jgi:branched-subunit amino acid ABC-type transport system permease component